MKYLKDKKITILEMTEGGPLPGSGGLQPIPNGENIWAYYRQASANEIEKLMTVYKVEVVFKIGWRDDIDTYMKIRFRGKEYNITRIDDFEGNREDLTIYAYSTN
jgi:SPP1 family predicted phage head-tail adaptor